MGNAVYPGSIPQYNEKNILIFSAEYFWDVLSYRLITLKKFKVKKEDKNLFLFLCESNKNGKIMQYLQ